jgi:hypothetical protein
VMLGNMSFHMMHKGTLFLKDTYFDIVNRFTATQLPESLALYSRGLTLAFSERFEPRGDKLFFQHSQFRAESGSSQSPNEQNSQPDVEGLKFVSHGQGEYHRGKIITRSSMQQDPAVSFILQKLGSNYSENKIYPILFTRTWRHEFRLDLVPSQHATEHPKVLVAVEDIEYYGLAGGMRVETAVILELQLEQNKLSSEFSDSWSRNLERHLSSLPSVRTWPLEKSKLVLGLEKSVF